jgi:hypothetical protein
MPWPFAFRNRRNVVLPAGTSGSVGGPVAPLPQLNGCVTSTAHNKFIVADTKNVTCTFMWTRLRDGAIIGAKEMQSFL